MAHILADPPSLVRCLVRAEFLHNLQSHHGTYHPAHILGIRCQPAASLQFQVRFDDPEIAGAMFCLPIQALCWKECHQPPSELVQPWDTFSADFTVHEFALWSRGNAQLLNVRQCPGYPDRLPGRYLFTLDFAGNALADDFEQHKQLHLIQVEGGWFAAVPNNRVLSIDEAFAKPCPTLPRFESLAHLLSAECPIGQPTLTQPTQPAPIPETATANIPWTPHHGGPCPLNDEAVEEWEYRLRTNMVFNSKEIETLGLSAVPSARIWNHYQIGEDLVAYRVLKWKPGHETQPTLTQP